MAPSGHPKVIFGAALIGMTIKDADEFSPIVAALCEEQILCIDTAARYPPPNMGESERILGLTGAVSKGIQIDTKVLLSRPDSSGELATAAVDRSIGKSLKHLPTKKVGTLYCHAFDPVTPLEETAAAFDRHFRAGAFEQWGVCRFTVDQLTELLSICEQHGYQKPKVYQGEYNLVTRGTEKTILPLLRKHGMAYNAHRPFATGFLTGNFVNGTTEGTRYADDFPLAPYFRQEYGSDALRKAMQALEKAASDHHVSSHEAAFRWLFFHSVLRPEDGVIFGSSRVAQIHENAEAIRKGPLPADLVKVMNDLWPTYFEGTDREGTR